MIKIYYSFSIIYNVYFGLCKTNAIKWFYIIMIIS